MILEGFESERKTDRRFKTNTNKSMEKLRYSSTHFCPSLAMGREGVKQGVTVSWPGLFTCVACSVAAVLCLPLTSLLRPSACFLEVVEKVAVAGGRFCVELLWFQLVSDAPSSSYRPSWAPHTASAGGFRRLCPPGFLAPGTLRTTREVCPTSGALRQETWPRRENAPLEQKAYLVLKWLHPETPKCSCITFLADLAGPIFYYLG